MSRLLAAWHSALLNWLPSACSAALDFGSLPPSSLADQLRLDRLVPGPARSAGPAAGHSATASSVRFTVVPGDDCACARSAPAPAAACAGVTRIPLGRGQLVPHPEPEQPAEHLLRHLRHRVLQGDLALVPLVTLVPGCVDLPRPGSADGDPRGCCSGPRRRRHPDLPARASARAPAASAGSRHLHRGRGARAVLPQRPAQPGRARRRWPRRAPRTRRAAPDRGAAGRRAG